MDEVDRQAFSLLVSYISDKWFGVGQSKSKEDFKRLASQYFDNHDSTQDLSDDKHVNEAYLALVQMWESED